MIRQWVPEEYATLCADSYGFSDTRPAARRHFKIDGPSALGKVLPLLAKRGEGGAGAPAQAIERFGLHRVHAGTTRSAGGDSQGGPKRPVAGRTGRAGVGGGA